jgi:hypothetical protein
VKVKRKLNLFETKLHEKFPEFFKDMKLKVLIGPHKSIKLFELILSIVDVEWQLECTIEDETQISWVESQIQACIDDPTGKFINTWVGDYTWEDRCGICERYGWEYPTLNKIVKIFL